MTQNNDEIMKILVEDDIDAAQEATVIQPQQPSITNLSSLPRVLVTKPVPQKTESVTTATPEPNNTTAIVSTVAESRSTTTSVEEALKLIEEANATIEDSERQREFDRFYELQRNAEEEYKKAISKIRDNQTTTVTNLSNPNNVKPDSGSRPDSSKTSQQNTINGLKSNNLPPIPANLPTIPETDEDEGGSITGSVSVSVRGSSLNQSVLPQESLEQIQQDCKIGGGWFGLDDNESFTENNVNNNEWRWIEGRRVFGRFVNEEFYAGTIQEPKTLYAGTIQEPIKPGGSVGVVVSDPDTLGINFNLNPQYTQVQQTHNLYYEPPQTDQETLHISPITGQSNQQPNPTLPQNSSLLNLDDFLQSERFYITNQDSNTVLDRNDEQAKEFLAAISKVSKNKFSASIAKTKDGLEFYNVLEITYEEGEVEKKFRITIDLYRGQSNQNPSIVDSQPFIDCGPQRDLLLKQLNSRSEEVNQLNSALIKIGTDASDEQQKAGERKTKNVVGGNETKADKLKSVNFIGGLQIG